MSDSELDPADSSSSSSISTERSYRLGPGSISVAETPNHVYDLLDTIFPNFTGLVDTHIEQLNLERQRHPRGLTQFHGRITRRQPGYPDITMVNPFLSRYLFTVDNGVCLNFTLQFVIDPQMGYTRPDIMGRRRYELLNRQQQLGFYFSTRDEPSERNVKLIYEVAPYPAEVPDIISSTESTPESTPPGTPPNEPEDLEPVLREIGGKRNRRSRKSHSKKNKKRNRKSKRKSKRKVKGKRKI
jgi:hypothetical protein